MPEALKFNQIAVAVEKTQGEKIGKQAKVKLYNIVKAADEDMVRKIKQVVDRVADKVREVPVAGQGWSQVFKIT